MSKFLTNESYGFKEDEYIKFFKNKKFKNIFPSTDSTGTQILGMYLQAIHELEKIAKEQSISLIEKNLGGDPWYKYNDEESEYYPPKFLERKIVTNNKEEILMLKKIEVFQYLNGNMSGNFKIAIPYNKKKIFERITKAIEENKPLSIKDSKEILYKLNPNMELFEQIISPFIQ
ncbi:MAG: hypothetical protein WC812_01820 [Candidatus Pacearchaeota archaeon]|jgi:hypothetical protein